MRALVDELTEALDGATVEQNGDRVEVTWEDGSVLKIDVTETRVMFGTLVSEKRGLYGKLCEILPDLFKARGVERFECSPKDKKSRGVLLKRGEWRDDGQLMVWEL